MVIAPAYTASQNALIVMTLVERIRQMTGAKSVELGETLQSLWSGYGVLQRAKLRGLKTGGPDAIVHVIIKHIDLSRARANRRGWSGEIAHARKVQSYRVEAEFYQNFAQHCDASCLVPQLIAVQEQPDQAGWLIVLADLTHEQFDCEIRQVDQAVIRGCLSWLANFHATFLGTTTPRLWRTGTYWHLETRPQELAAMPAGPLKESAAEIDRRLSGATFQTLVHGDAKLANFCISKCEPTQVAAVDFQYVGRGCGMKDVAYFISSCLDDGEAEELQQALLEHYFEALQAAITNRGLDVDFEQLKREWLALYPFAWADFCRFLAGWSPGHWKWNQYSQRLTEEALQKLGSS